jgi:hypothetical protein
MPAEASLHANRERTFLEDRCVALCLIALRAMQFAYAADFCMSENWYAHVSAPHTEIECGTAVRSYSGAIGSEVE